MDKMTSRDFAYWLQGFFEINEPQTINKQQVEVLFMATQC